MTLSADHLAHGAAETTSTVEPTSGAPVLTESAAWSITSYLLAGALLGALAGYGVDRLLGTHFIVGIGLVLGKALTLYYLWLRYGTTRSAPGPRSHNDVRTEELT